MKKVSIIIPCYNAVSSIDACMESVVQQTMPVNDIEIILVNDASTDDTFTKLCEWEQRYPESIMVINCEENGKQGKARDIGMQYASGQYIGFMDDDDWIEPDMYETLYRAAEDNDCDLVVCQLLKRLVMEDTACKDKGFEDVIWDISSKEDRRHFLEKDINVEIWNKLYKRELLSHYVIDFPSGYIYDDIYFSALVKQYCKRVYISSKVLYHHIVSENSVSYGSENPMDRIGFIEVHMMLIEELRQRGLYDAHVDWYEEKFVVDYLTFITNYEKSFGALSAEIKNVIIDGIWELFPDFDKISLVDALVQKDDKPVYKRILAEVMERKPNMKCGRKEKLRGANTSTLVDILVPVGEKGGVENIINMTIPYLHQQGMEVRVVQLVSSGVVWTEEGIPYYTLLEGLEGHTMAEFIQVYANFVNKNGMPDCILATSWPMMCYVARKVVEYFEQKDTRIISWLHNPVYMYEQSGFGGYNELAYADAHFAISNSIMQGLNEHFADRTVEYVYNPVDFEKCISDSSKRMTQQDCKRNQEGRIRKLYFVGRVDEQKRLDLVIQALASAGDSWELFLIGDDDNSYGKQIKKLVNICGVKKRVHWLGWQSNPWSHVVDADAVVLASDFEGYPLVAIEAQANGLPVIATPVSGIEELITDGENGYLFPCGDWKALSDILYKIGTGELPSIDSDICRQRVLPFEKKVAVADFYNKLCKILECTNEADVEILQASEELKEDEDTSHMTRQEIYNTNVQLQGIIYEIIYACRTQNHDRAIRSFTGMTNLLMSVLQAVFADIAYYNQEMDIVNPDGVNASLQDILMAQENKDYVLLADLLELQLVPFLQSLQEAIRCYDGLGTNPSAWERNMEVLKDKDAELWKQVMTYHECYERENAAGTWGGVHHLEATNSGAFTMAGQDEAGMYYYHSNVNPMAEAATFARYYYSPASEKYVVWGLGLGYHVQEMMKLDDGIGLTVYESDMDVIYHCLMAVDMAWCMKLPGFSIIYDAEFTKIIDALEHLTENFILHYPSLRHIADGRIREQMEMFFIRDSGKRNAAILFESNSRENFKYYDGYVDELRPQFEEKDVVIVAAGPSLDKNVELLKNKKPNMVILAVETVFRKLISMGIDLDYMIVTDANARIYSHMAGLESQQIPMLYLSTTYKGFAMRYQGSKYLICQKGYDKAEELAHKNSWNLYETGGSVSTTALDVCISLGAKSIAFIGLDLAYTDNLAHTSGTAARRQATEAEEMQNVPAIGGGIVPASKVFMIYNKWIANRVVQKDVTMVVYDATEGGAVVPGLEIITLESYMKQIGENR